MKRSLLLSGCILILFSICSMVFSQTGEVGRPSADKIGVDTAQQYLRKITITKFEDASFWRATIPGDQGQITWRRLAGKPQEKAVLDKDRLDAEKALKYPIPEGGYVLGVRVDFYKRGMNEIWLSPR